MSGREPSPLGDNQLLRIDGAFNVRDIGGYPTAGGARVLPRRLLRSASLDSLTPQGVRDLQALKLRTVLDLRSSEEVQRHGAFPVDQIPVRWEHLPSQVSPPSGDDEQSRRMRSHPDPMSPMYQEIVRTDASEFARGLRILADPANHPAIAHCTSGKDRTGLFVVILHLVIGVSLDDALAHYQQDQPTTDRAMADMLARYPEMAAMPPAKMERMAGTNNRWVTGALASLGGEDAVPEWLARHGCDHHVQASLRSSFLEV